MILKIRLKAILKERDMTAAQLARKCGLPRQTIGDWLAGTPPRDVRQLKKVADALEVSVDHLCFGAPNDITQQKVMELDALLGERWISGLFEVRFRRIKKTRSGDDD